MMDSQNLQDCRSPDNEKQERQARIESENCRCESLASEKNRKDRQRYQRNRKEAFQLNGSPVPL